MLMVWLEGGQGEVRGAYPPPTPNTPKSPHLDPHPHHPDLPHLDPPPNRVRGVCGFGPGRALGGSAGA